jgi:two-component system, OmpR family, sensor kinase
MRIGGSLEEVERLSKIVEVLFAMVRLDGGEAVLQRKVFDIAELARTTLEQMRLLSDDKNISISIDTARVAPVMGDAGRLKQVIVNLLDNSIKHTMSGGAISLSIRTSPSKVIMLVSDNGVGISANALPHIFERFYRADKTRFRDVQGAGLGLSIVQAICQAHGGTVKAISQEGQGTTIAVELPLADPPRLAYRPAIRDRGLRRYG